MTTTAPLAPGPIDAGARPTRHPGRWAAAALVLAAILVVAVVRGSEDPAPDDPTDPVVAAGDEVVVIAGADGEPVDLVSVVTGGDTTPLRSDRTLVRAGFDGEVRWRRLVDPDVALSVVAADERTVLLGEVPLEAAAVAGSGGLTALAADDGRVLWRATPPSASIPRLVGDRVLVPGDAGLLTALDAATGEEVWSHDDPENTSGLPPEIDLVGDDTVLVERTRVRYGLELVPVALDDGTEGPSHAPECPRATGEPERAGGNARVLVVPGTTDAVTVFGSGSQCVQRWDTTTGEQRWSTTTVPEPADAAALPTVPRGVALDGDHLAFDGSAGIVVVDLADGTHRVLDGVDGRQIAPLLVVGDSVVGAEVDDDGATPDLAGWSVDGTAPRWTDVHLGGPRAAEGLVVSPRAVLSPSDALSSTVVADEDDGVMRTVLLDGPRRGEVGTLDPATGEVTRTSFRLPAPVEGALVDSVPSSVEIVGDRAVVVVAGLPHLVDLTTGEVVASWPARQP